MTTETAQPRIDLHCHSVLSDGSLTPEFLVLRACQMQLDWLAITDHDSTAAFALARAAAEQLSGHRPEIISGVEFSCRWQGFEIHVLGWNFDPEHPAMRERVATQQAKRRERALAIAERLIKNGVQPEHLPDFNTEGVVTRAHFAELLTKFHYAPTIEQAFRRYLGKGCCAYVPTEWCTLEEAIEAITAAGGTSSLAHPLAYQLSTKWLKRLIESYVQAGGTALEVCSGQQAPAQRHQLAELARHYGLKASVGSDFHRPGKWRELGRNLKLPDGLEPVWQDWQIVNEQNEKNEEQAGKSSA